MGMSITGFENMEKKFDESYLTQEMKFAMEDTVEFTKDVIVDTIENSGTDKTWSRAWFGRTGTGRARVNTGEMRNSVNTDVTVVKNGVVEGRAGWLEGTPTYLKFQEFGFRHWITGEYIEGMQSLREGAEQGEQEAVRLLDKIAKDMAK